MARKRKTPREIRVSDHALLRYCERVLGADLEELRLRILGEVAMPAEVLGSGIYPLMKGRYRAVVENRTVLTILPGAKQQRDAESVAAGLDRKK